MVTANVTESLVVEETPVQSRLRTGIRLVRDLLKFHPRLFAIAVAGASLYAVCTVVSSLGVAFLVDSVILPRFVAGQIDTGVYVTGAAIVIGIGLLRAFGVVVRRSFAGVNNWRTVESLTMLLVRQIMTQPSIWHKKRMTGDLVARVGVDSDAAAEVLGPLPFSTAVVRPDVLILDEATSSVDASTEVRISRALRKLALGRTTVSIAHRLSTAARAERVVLLENGRIIEDGSHDQLIAKNGRYARQYQSWVFSTQSTI